MTNKLVRASVTEISPLTNSILRLILSPEDFINYHAGQYLQVMQGAQALSYSIANAPLGSHTYELHIRHSKDNPYNQPLLEDIKQKGEVILSLPHGTCHMKTLHPEKSIIFIAAGTGFAPIKAMIEQILADGSQHHFELYWGARTQSDLYMEEQVIQWQKHVPQFKYFSHITKLKKSSLGEEILARHQHDLDALQFVIAGPFDMVYSTRDLLVLNGADQQSMYSDAFDFER
tara:strand:+ start:1102 stop:1794 length:693 start_codon:yes stop_codon:yes gene_type:complete